MSNTEFTICNAALTLLGADAITDFEGESTESKVASYLYDMELKNRLSLYPWTFCTFLEELGAPDAGAPDALWDRSWTLPTSVLLLRSVTVGDIILKYERSGSKILCNAGVDDRPVIWATYAVDENTFPPYFVMAMALQLATIFSGPLTEMAPLIERYNVMAMQQWAMARAADAQSKTTKKVNTSRLLTQRR